MFYLQGIDIDLIFSFSYLWLLDWLLLNYNIMVCFKICMQYIGGFGIKINIFLNEM